ncbi:MAG: CCA tRNA nucleotidyltransferase [Alphaproteobacteria bacterium]|nr:CCA tRNA nucleotidyltransferase [Alphaproteobacteria bacterium]
MKHTLTIPLPPELTDHNTCRLMNLLGGDKSEPDTLFVGGVVRNMVLGVPVGDVDMATRYTPDEVMSRLAHNNITVIPTGFDHGTVTAVMDNRPYEITTLRRDVTTDGRRADVAFTDSWAQDSARRDFTMNALYADMQGRVYDPTGQGISDIKNQRVRFVGSAQARVAEDYLRILRYFRFHLFYGAEEPDPEALQACREGARNVMSLSRERITQECKKILAHPQPSAVLSRMFDLGVLSDLPDHAYDPHIMSLYRGDDVILRLFILNAMRNRDMSPWLLLSGADKKALTILTQAYDFVTSYGMTEDKVREMMYRFGRDTAQRACLVASFQAGRNVPEVPVQDILTDWIIPVFPVRGDDLIRQGMKPGPEMGNRLKELEEKWIANGFN